MQAAMILTVVGCDRPGLTQAVAEAVAAAGGNWLESHLSRLRGMYVGSILVELPHAKMDGFREAMARIDSSGLQVTLLPAGDEKPTTGSEMAIQIVGQDRPGIVRELTTAIASLGGNIDRFVSSVVSGSWTGALLFRATAEVTLPLHVSEDHVREALESVSGEIMVDFEPVNRGTPVSDVNFA